MTPDPAVLLAQLRAALDESDRIAQEAGGGRWVQDGAEIYWDGIREWVGECLVDDDATSNQNAAHIAANSPARVLALNAALRTVLDGAEQTISEHSPLRRRDEFPAYRRAVETVTVLAAGLTEETT